MRLSDAPDLGAPRLMLLAALALTVGWGVVLGVQYWGPMNTSLGDTDDATRLVLVRGLLAGQGWWAQHFMRYQPPVGTYMHWSRLLDGGIAALDAAFRLVLSADDAETATRLVWPLLWIFPAALGALALARRLGDIGGGRAAVLICAILLAGDLSLYMQFRPGRIDHHDVQMTLAMLALAGGVQRRAWGAALAGVATGLGLAVGLEALLYDAIIGAGLALAFLADPGRSRSAAAYGLALLATTVMAYGVQTPPWRWSVSACDCMGLNLVAALAAAGAGLALTAWGAARRPWPVRLAALALVGAVAGGLYLGLDPDCRHGFFANVDPRIRPIWLNFVQETRPIGKIWKLNRVQGAEFIVTWAMGLAAWVGLGFRRAWRRDFAWRLAGACLIPSVAVAASAIRMTGYAEWFAVPVLAVAAAEVADWYGRGRLLIVIAAAAVASPVAARGLADQGVKLIPEKATHKPGSKPVHAAAKKKKEPRDQCFDTDAYDDLDDASPAGLVLSEVDLGPFVVANTDDSALSAPYHRLSYGILKAYSILAAPADGAAATLARQAGVSYVLECRFHARHGDRDLLSKTSLQKRLDSGQPPAWLQPLSPKTAPLQAYRVLPAAPAPTQPPKPAAAVAGAARPARARA